MDPIIFPVYLFFLWEGGGLRDLGLELHADSHYLHRRGVCEEVFLPVITWTRERLFTTGELLHYIFFLLLLTRLENIGDDDDRSPQRESAFKAGIIIVDSDIEDNFRSSASKYRS